MEYCHKSQYQNQFFSQNHNSSPLWRYHTLLPPSPKSIISQQKITTNLFSVDNDQITKLQNSFNLHVILMIPGIHSQCNQYMNLTFS